MFFSIFICVIIFLLVFCIRLSRGGLGRSYRLILYEFFLEVFPEEAEAFPVERSEGIVAEPVAGVQVVDFLAVPAGA